MLLREAADQLGVHYQTAYEWVRDGVLPARKVGRAYQLRPADVRAFNQQRLAGSPPPPQVAVRDWSGQAGRFYSALAAGRERTARQQLDRLSGHVPFAELCISVFAPALARIGDEWAIGHLSAAHEHRASAICERLIAATAPWQPQGRPRGTAIVTTPPGERHALPALMAAACLREDHWLVHDLASDLPAAEIDGLASEAGADLIVLSCATTAGSQRGDLAARQLGPRSRDRRVLVGRPGDSVLDLLAQARTART